MDGGTSLRLGILACPGGEHFADTIIGHLQIGARDEFEERVALLARKFALPEKEVVTRINMTRDAEEPQISHTGPSDRYREPDIKIPARFVRFANGEFKTEILRSVRDMDVFVVQDVANEYPREFSDGETHTLSINDHIFCLLVTVDAAVQAGARRVSLVLPTYPYARQHKKRTREGLTASRFGQIMEFMGVQRILTLDIHSREIENTFNHLRLDNLHASYEIVRTLVDVVGLDDPALVVIAPDTGAIDRNRFYAQALRRPLGLLYKERDYSRHTLSAEAPNITNVRLLGEVKDRIVFMSDDMLGTGGTILKAMRLLKELGTRKTICAVSLPMFNNDAIDRFDDAYLEGLFDCIIGTNAIYHNGRLLAKSWYHSADVSDLFARAIYRLHRNQSVSKLLDNRREIEQLVDDGK
jgi:ribose-phosphate pyrophosphokinase